MKALLSDGSKVEFKEISKQEFEGKLKLQTREGEIYRTLWHELKSEKIQEQIKTNFPKPEIHRRNTGYALDEIIDSDVFSDSKKDICTPLFTK